MIVLAFGDYRVPLAPAEWETLGSFARALLHDGVLDGAQERTCIPTGVATVIVSDDVVLRLAAAIETASMDGTAAPELMALGKDLLDYADHVEAARRRRRA